MIKSEKKQELKKLIISIEAHKEQKKMSQDFFDKYNIKKENLMGFQTTKTESSKEMMNKVFILAGKHIKENPDRFKTGDSTEKIDSIFRALAEILDGENGSFARILLDYVINQTNEVNEILDHIDI